MKETQDVSQNILLIGQAGIGKSSIAKMIPEYILECQYLYVNASDENGIDTIRNKVTRFAQTASFDGKRKVVILDEACGLSNASQDALRNGMEEYNKHCIFILTANYGEKIHSPIKSRCKSFNISYGQKEYVKHILTILKKEEAQVKGNVIEFIKPFFPDFRKCLNELQGQFILGDGHIDISDIKQANTSFVEQLWDKVTSKTDINEILEFMIENEDEFQGSYDVLTSRLFYYVCSLKNLNPNDKSFAVKTLGEGLEKIPDSLNGDISLSWRLVAISERF